MIDNFEFIDVLTNLQQFIFEWNIIRLMNYTLALFQHTRCEESICASEQSIFSFLNKQKLL